MQSQDQVLSLKKLIDKHEKILKKKEKDIEEMEKKLQEICPHNKTKKVEEYIEGSYLDRSEYITATVCEICSKEMDRKVTLGGFN